MIHEMMGDTVKGTTPSNTGKTTNKKSAAASGDAGRRNITQAQAAEAVQAVEGDKKPNQTGKPAVNQGNRRPYTVSQRKSDVSAQYRESVAKEQKFWLEEMGLEEETNGKEDKEKKNGVGKADELQRQLDSLQRMLDRIRKQREEARKKEKNKKKKNVNYSYSRVSAVISRAKSSTQASAALSTASANLSMVRRMAATGQYQSKDIELALAHAQKMVRTARKKFSNIKYEVQLKKRNKSKEDHKKQRVAQTHRPVRKYKAQKELERLKTQLKNQENMEKNRNRRVEEMELMMADMQYIRRKIELLKNDATGSESSQSILSETDGFGDEIMSSVANMESLGMAETAMDAQAGAEVAATAGDAGAVVSGGE